MSVAAEVRSARIAARMTMNDLAKAARVAVSTISRIESGSIDPRVGVYRALLSACGLDAGEASYRDSSAALAARALLTGEMAGIPPIVAAKISAFQRLGWVDADLAVSIPVIDFLQAVGSMSTIAARRGTVVFDGADGVVSIAERLRHEGIRNVISGPEALVRLGADGANISPVVYVESAAAARRALRLEDFEPMVTPVAGFLLPFDGVSEIGGAGGMAHPVQAVIDGFCGTSRMPEMAEQVVEQWEDSRAAA